MHTHTCTLTCRPIPTHTLTFTLTLDSSLVPRSHPLMRKGVWWPLSDFLVVPSQQNAISHVTWVVQQRSGWDLGMRLQTGRPVEHMVVWRSTISLGSVSRLLTRHNQEIAQWSPDPFPHERVGSGHETTLTHALSHVSHTHTHMHSHAYSHTGFVPKNVLPTGFTCVCVRVCVCGCAYGCAYECGFVSACECACVGVHECACERACEACVSQNLRLPSVSCAPQKEHLTPTLPGLKPPLCAITRPKPWHFVPKGLQLTP